MSYPSVSILIPTHNRCEILSQTLNSLAQLRVPEGADIELIVIANACTDDTTGIVKSRERELVCPVRCIVEPKPGLSVARNRCVQEARHEIMAFLDDDVWVEPGWLEGVMSVYQDYPADLLGGKIELWWAAVDPPSWVGPSIESLLSVNDSGPQIKEVLGPERLIGANFSFRRRIFETVGAFREDLGRIGQGLMAAEESEFVSRALKAGFRAFYTPEASVKHWVAPHRISIPYLYHLAKGKGASRVLAKPRWGIYVAARAFVGHSYLVLRHGTSAGVCRVLGREKQMVWHLMKLAAGVGGLQGVWQRVRGVNRPIHT